MTKNEEQIRFHELVDGDGDPLGVVISDDRNEVRSTRRPADRSSSAKWGRRLTEHEVVELGNAWAGHGEIPHPYAGEDLALSLRIRLSKR